MPGVSEQLTEHALRQLNLSHTSWRSGPFPQFESINAQNRFSILALVMQRYNKDLDAFHSHALISACRVSHKLSQTGFSLDSDSEPRIALSPALLVELLISVYYAMFNGHHKAALKAVESVHKRASYELFSDVLLMTNALLNSHRRGNFKLERDDSIAKSTKIAHPRGTSITNASFKAKKLPDDIEFVEGDDVHKLATVDELETEQSVTKALKAKLMNIGGKLGGDRNKNRDSLTPRHDGDSPRGDPMDSVDVAVVKAGGFGSSRRGSGGSSVSGSSKIIVDMLEMQPVRTRGLRNQNGGDFEENGNDSGEAEYCESSDGGSSDKTTATTKIASSSLIFSKKHGISKVSGQAPGSQASSRITSSPSAPGQSSFSSPNLNTSSVNGKPHGDGPDFSSPRAQSEGPVGKDAKPRAPPSLSSMSTPPSSSSSSFPNSSSQAIHSSSSLASEPPHANSSVPHTAAAPSSSTSTHSMPEELNASSSKREKRYSGKGRVNRNSYSTDL
ncbi:uncharacterized protein DDB_G0271670 [Aplysia californica]|uniref:Uncharacterized protein DDB_G0271670 n=1 Tax=Aplysia californica TaxID=6500 RepID=A0ABM0JYX3_APLCA|nr:uncharacterized protein DDB_G0271670 [Aplysia californica]